MCAPPGEKVLPLRYSTVHCGTTPVCLTEDCRTPYCTVLTVDYTTPYSSVLVFPGKKVLPLGYSAVHCGTTPVCLTVERLTVLGLPSICHLLRPRKR